MTIPDGLIPEIVGLTMATIAAILLATTWRLGAIKTRYLLAGVLCFGLGLVALKAVRNQWPSNLLFIAGLAFAVVGRLHKPSASLPSRPSQ